MDLLNINDVYYILILWNLINTISMVIIAKQVDKTTHK